MRELSRIANRNSFSFKYNIWRTLLVKKKLVIRILTYTVAAINVLAIVIAIVLANFWIYYTAGGIFVLDLGFFYVRASLRRKLRYPLIPPEGRTDWYVPTTNIPRPVIADYCEIEEKKESCPS
jgi:hypothetical protein